MKKLTVLLTVLCLLLCGCTPAAPTPTEPTVPTLPQSTGPQLYFPTLPDIGSYKRPNARRMFPGYTDSVPPREDYGELIPYVGKVLSFEIADADEFYEGSDYEYEPYREDHYRYGLCTADGVIVTDPVYSAFERCGDTYLLSYPSKGPDDYSENVAVCRSDGSMYRQIIADGSGYAQLSADGERLIIDRFTEDSYYVQLCDLDGTPISGRYNYMYEMEQSGYFVAYTDDASLLLDRNGNNALDREFDRIDCYAGTYLLEQSGSLQITDSDFRELYRFQPGADYYSLCGPTLLNYYSDGAAHYLDLSGTPMDWSGFAYWDSGFYFLNESDRVRVFTRDLTQVMELPASDYCSCYGSRYLVASRYDFETEDAITTNRIYDLETGSETQWEGDVLELIRRGDSDVLLSRRDSGLYNALTGEQLFPGSLLRSEATGRGTVLLVLDGHRLLTLDPAGNVIVEFSTLEG